MAGIGGTSAPGGPSNPSQNILTMLLGMFAPKGGTTPGPGVSPATAPMLAGGESAGGAPATAPDAQGAASAPGGVVANTPYNAPPKAKGDNKQGLSNFASMMQTMPAMPGVDSSNIGGGTGGGVTYQFAPQAQENPILHLMRLFAQGPPPTQGQG